MRGLNLTGAEVTVGGNPSVFCVAVGRYMSPGVLVEMPDKSGSTRRVLVVDPAASTEQRGDVRTCRLPKVA